MLYVCLLMKAFRPGKHLHSSPHQGKHVSCCYKIATNTSGTVKYKVTEKAFGLKDVTAVRDQRVSPFPDL